MHMLVGMMLNCGVAAMAATLFWVSSSLFGWLALAFAFLAYFYAPYWKVRMIPSAPTTPIVGHLPLLAKYGPDVLRSFAKQYGPVFRFHMGRQPLVIVADPELCREVGIKRFKDIRNRSNPSPTSGSPLHEKGLFLMRDSRWWAMRNAIIPFYQPSRLSSLIPTMQSIIESATTNLAGNGVSEGATGAVDIDLSNLSLRMAIDVIGKTAFGVDFGLSSGASSRDESIKVDREKDERTDTADVDPVSRFLQQHIYSTESLKMDLSGSFSTVVGLLVPFLQKPCRMLLQWIPGTADHKMRQTSRELYRRLDHIVTDRIHELELVQKQAGSDSAGASVGAAKDFLTAFLNISKMGGAKSELFTREYVSALAYEHLLAGSATTAFTVSAAVYLVCQHPKVESKLRQEIDAFGPLDRAPTAEDLHTRFPYLDQVIKEAMRFYTVSPLVARETSSQVEVGGFTLPKGTWVWLALGVLAKDPRNFRDPDVFLPERFDPNCMEDKLRHPYAHIPFGIGPRTCIGQKFALQEIKLTLIHLYRHYDFKISPKMEVPLEMEYGLVLNFKHGVKVQVTKRSPESSNQSTE